MLEEPQSEKTYPFDNLSPIARRRLEVVGKWTTRTAFPVAVGTGLALAYMNQHEILGVSPDLAESPQTLLAAVPPAAVYVVGKILELGVEAADERSSGQQR